MDRQAVVDFVECEVGPDEAESIILLDGFDVAFIGLTADANPKAVYSVDKIIQSLTESMSLEEAWEYFYFNIECAYLGEKTPIYIKQYESSN